MNDKQQQLLALADELGVGPTELETLQSRKITSRYNHASELEYRTSVPGSIEVRLNIKYSTWTEFYATDVVRWGESLVAAARKAQK